jgi:hypothetical protein
VGNASGQSGGDKEFQQFGDDGLGSDVVRLRLQDAVNGSGYGAGDRPARGALPSTWYGGSRRASLEMAGFPAAARRASAAPEDPPNTAAEPPAAAMTAARSSASRSTA